MWHQARTDKPTDKKDNKMKGLLITILLGTLEVTALMTGGGDLLTDGPAEAASQIVASRREESGVQAEVLVDAERADISDLEPAAPVADPI
jgi:hypothetical protein